MALPPLVLQALAHALDYLKAFNLEAVLRVGAAFHPLQSVHEMSLSPNTLWHALLPQSRPLSQFVGGVFFFLD